MSSVKNLFSEIDKKIAEKSNAFRLKRKEQEDLERIKAEEELKAQQSEEPAEEVKAEESVKPAVEAVDAPEISKPEETESVISPIPEDEEQKAETAQEKPQVVAEEVKPAAPKAEEKPQVKGDVIEKTDNPNIVIVNGKRVFRPQPPKIKEYVNTEPDRQKRPYKPGEKRPLDGLKRDFAPISSHIPPARSFSPSVSIS